MASRRQSKVKWLQEQLQVVPECSVNVKYVKFSDIHKLIQENFPSESISTVEASRIIKEAFPSSQSRHFTTGNRVFGVQLRVPPVSSTSTLSNPPTELNVNPVPSLLVTDQSLRQELELERQKNAQLVVKVQGLEAIVRQQEHQLENMGELVSVSLASQLDQVVQHTSHQICHGPDSIEHFDAFSVEDVIRELQSDAPDVYQLFQTLGNTQRNKRSGQETYSSEELKVLMSACILLNAWSQRVKGLQLLMSIMVARSTSKHAITVLNHAGVCMSYDRTWYYLQKLTNEAQYLEIVKQGHWMWAYDNINIHMRARHERQDYHSKMLNATSRLAISIQHLPEWEVDWDDTKPQKLRRELQLHDILPSEADGEEFHRRAVHFVMQLLVTEFDSLSNLSRYLPPETPVFPAAKTNVVPMRLLFRDEKYTSENVEILRETAKDANLQGSPQVVIGDQMTCKNIRTGKMWMTPEIQAANQLKWANEVPGDFHFLWECLKVIVDTYWGQPSFAGSLCHLREYINRLSVDKKAKTFSIADEFVLHTFRAHVLAAICDQLHIQSPSDPVAHDPTVEWLEKTATSIVDNTLTPPLCSSQDPVYGLHRSFVATTFLYYDLRQAIRYENGPHIMRLWKMWLLRFLGTGKKNYSTEAAHLICNVLADYPRHIAYIVVHNRTVNIDGKPGHGKPIDQLVEHYNLMIKETLRASGANVTDNHTIQVSLAALFLLEASKKVSRHFGVHQTSHHTVRDPISDVHKMCSCLLRENVTKEIKERTGSPFVDPVTIGMEKIAGGWLDRILDKSDTDSAGLEENDGNDDIDIDYELHQNV